MNATGTDTANVRITAPAVNNASSYTLSVVVTDGKTSVQSNVQVTVNPKAADEVTPPADEVTLHLMKVRQPVAATRLLMQMPANMPRGIPAKSTTMAIP